MPKDAGPCTNPRNWHDPMPAIRALLVALDEWVVNGREPPVSRLPRIADGTWLALKRWRGRSCPRWCAPRAMNGASPLNDWTDPDNPPVRGARWCRRWMPMATNAQVCACPTSLSRMAHSPAGICTSPRCRKVNWRIATARSWRLPRRPPSAKNGDQRPSLAERYPTHDAYVAGVQAVVIALQQERLLLEEDAATYLARAHG